MHVACLEHTVHFSNLANWDTTGSMQQLSEIKYRVEVLLAICSVRQFPGITIETVRVKDRGIYSLINDHTTLATLCRLV